MANTPIDSMTATFGIGDQTAIKMNVTDSGPSNDLSKLIDLQVGGVSKFKVTKEGYVTATNYTGSVSGSVFISNSPSLSGYQNVVFATGNSGKQVLRVDGGNFRYDPLNENLEVGSTIYVGTSIDVSNVTATIFSSPQNLTFAPSAIDLIIGNPSLSTNTRFLSDQVRAKHFTGSFSGSISGSKAVFRSLNATFTGSISGSRANFTRLSGSNARIVGRIVAASFSGSISSSKAFVRSITSSKIIVGNNVIATSYTGSISGSRANFTRLSGSNATIVGRVIATNYTGSISGSFGKFTNLTVKDLVVNQNVQSDSFTGSLSGSVYVKNSPSLATYQNILFVSDDINPQILRTDSAGLTYLPSTNILDVNGSIVVTTTYDVSNTSCTLFSTPFGLTIGPSADQIIVGSSNISSYTHFSNEETRGHFTGSFSGSISGSKAVFKKINATSITSSITGTRGFFTRLTSSTANFTIRANAPEFTGSISGSRGIFTRITGSFARFSNRVVSTSFTGSISGSRANFTRLSASRARIARNVIATSFTGSISGSNAWFSNNVSASTIGVKNNVVANSFTGSINGNKAKFINLYSQKITGSLISSSVGIFTHLTASKVKLNSINANGITSSLSGSIFVNINTSNSDFYLLGSLVDQGTTSILTDPDIIYNRSLKYLWVTTNVMTSNVVTDPTTLTSSLFNNSPTLIIGQNSSLVRIGKSSPRIVLGQNNTQVILSGSITGSRSRFRFVSGSVGKIDTLVGFTSSFSTGYFNKLSSSYITGSNNKFINVSGSKAYFTKLTGSVAKVETDLTVMNDIEVSGSFKFRFPMTGSGPSTHKLFISGAGALQGYMGIMINGTKYKIPLYAW